MRSIYYGLVLAASMAGAAADSATSNWTNFNDVVQILQSNLPPDQVSGLDQMAVDGLIGRLGALATVRTQQQASAAASVPLVSKSAAYDNAFIYLRIGRIDPGVAEDVSTAYHQIASSNKISKAKGLVLDLRFATGTNYEAAIKLVNLFMDEARPLLDWGNGPMNATPAAEPIKLPIAVLVNSETAGAAEAVAAMLRNVKSGIVIGSPTAGRASVYRDFPLKDGRIVSIASVPVKLAEGSTLSGTPLKPDISVTVGSAREKDYFADEYKGAPSAIVASTSASATNGWSSGSAAGRMGRRRLNEAELVRLQKDGTPLEPDRIEQPEIGGTRAVMDPVLARGLDVLRGLAVIQAGNRS